MRVFWCFEVVLGWMLLCLDTFVYVNVVCFYIGCFFVEGFVGDA